jgi:hypothetical protein
MNASLGSSNLICTDSVPSSRKCLPDYRVGTRGIVRYMKAQIFNKFYFEMSVYIRGHTVAQLVEALCYKPEGRGVRFPRMSLDFIFSFT